MVVAVCGSESAEHEDVAYFFCSSGCRARVEREPAKYARTTR
jgi:YHS domain-containing protein